MIGNTDPPSHRVSWLLGPTLGNEMVAVGRVRMLWKRVWRRSSYWTTWRLVAVPGIHRSQLGDRRKEAGHRYYCQYQLE